MESAILVENLGKRFNRYHADKPLTIMDAVLSGLRRIKPVDDFWALRGICFEVNAGEMLGVIGHNGAGKSTLLQILGKVAYPTEGHLEMRGRVGALLDLGAGFHGDLTGRENVFVSAIVAGLPRCEVARRFDQMVEFAELSGFIDNPVRTYSTGMMMRLAFSVAVHCDPQILLVDEFLSVGDIAFQSKCLKRILAMKEQGCAIVLVSHDVSQVERLCDRALWLKHGTVKAYGDSDTVAGQYASDMLVQTQQRMPTRADQLSTAGIPLRMNDNRFGSLEIEIAGVRLLPKAQMKSGDRLYVDIDYKNERSVASAHFTLSISGQDGQKYLDVTTAGLMQRVVPLEKSGTFRLSIERVDLASGDYFVEVGIYEKDWSYAYDSHSRAYPLTVYADYVSTGILAPPISCEIVLPRSSSYSKKVDIDPR
ncbi:MAG: ABC transporter ATP-binding protein [Phormidesmis sp.]